MKPTQAREPSARPAEKSLGRVVLDDLRETDFHRSFRNDLKEIYRFYLSEERRAELARMGTLRGMFWFWWWLVKSLMLKLTPARRVAIVAAAFLLMTGDFRMRAGNVQIAVHLGIVGVVLVFIVLMLELKDKLLARDEIEVARQVQLALLPRRHPQIEGWSIWSHTQPANDVGGDLVDYLDPGAGRLGIALGDVAGKGLGAALLMAKLQATLRALAPTMPTLAELGQHLNEILLRDGLENRFATLFYVEIEASRGRVSYLNAGHNPPLLVRPQAVEDLRAGSPPLGMLAAARYTQESRDMAVGETLVVYSDGLTEALDEQEQEFGMERLRALAGTLAGQSAEEAGQKLLREIRAFLGETRPLDDLSLVVLARR